MSNNLRVIYKNLVDLSTTTLTPSSTASTATLATNLKLDPKSIVWRSATATSDTNVKANLVINFTNQVPVTGIVLAFNNLSSQAYVRVRCFTGSAPTLGGTVDVPTVNIVGTLVYDSNNVVIAEPQGLGTWLWGTSELGINAYVKRKNYGRVWIPNSLCSNMLIEIVDPYNTDRYIEVSRLVIGSHWSPQYNTGFGLEAKHIDTSTHDRTESGDIVTKTGPVYNTLKFDLQYMSAIDRVQFNTLIKSTGTKKPIFISLFPENTSDIGKEQTYQMYGKLSQLYGIEHPIFETYSSQIELEEI